MSETYKSFTYKSKSTEDIQSISPGNITPASTLQPNLTQESIDLMSLQECVRNEANVLEVNIDEKNNLLVFPLERIAAFDLESFHQIHNVDFEFFTAEIAFPEDAAPGDDTSIEITDKPGETEIDIFEKPGTTNDLDIFEKPGIG